MNDKQENKVSMYFAVVQVVDANNAVWAGTPAFVNAEAAFGTVMGGIQDLVEVQETVITGVRTDKLVALDAMVEKALLVSGAVFAYATDTDNNTLKEAVAYSASDLKYVRDTIAAERATVIHDQANAVIASLADYDVDAAVLTELTGLIDAFAALIPGPRVAITARKGATSGLVELMKEADSLLKERLDKLMNLYKVTDLEFYTHYFNARIIVGNASGSAAGDTSEPEVG